MTAEINNLIQNIMYSVVDYMYLLHKFKWSIVVFWLHFGVLRMFEVLNYGSN